MSAVLDRGPGDENDPGHQSGIAKLSFGTA
jgi:hypothetical protein